jgi:GT2 family glycosyltransferase
VYLCFTDDDCEPHDDWVEQLVNRLQRGADAAAGATLSGGGVLAAASEITAHAPATARPPDGSDLAFAPSNNLACTKAAFEATPFDESYPDAAGEDREWCARLTFAGYVLRAEPNARVVHHQELTFARFLRQQARYGRGAFRFRRHGGDLRPLDSPTGFYKALLRQAFAHSFSVGLLVCVAQAATAAGFIQVWAVERVRRPGLTDWMRAHASRRDGL